MLGQPLQIDGWPYPPRSSPDGTDISSAHHALELLVTTKKANLGLLKKVLEERSKVCSARERSNLA